MTAPQRAREVNTGGGRDDSAGIREARFAFPHYCHASNYAPSKATVLRGRRGRRGAEWVAVVVMIAMVLVVVVVVLEEATVDVWKLGRERGGRS